MKIQSERIPVLAGIKLFHTAIWLLFAGCIVTISFAGAGRQFRLAAVLTGVEFELMSTSPEAWYESSDNPQLEYTIKSHLPLDSTPPDP